MLVVASGILRTRRRINGICGDYVSVCVMYRRPVLTHINARSLRLRERSVIGNGQDVAMATRSKGFTAAVSCVLAQLALLVLYAGAATLAGADLAALAQRILSIPALAALLMSAHLLLSALGTAALCALVEHRGRHDASQDEPFDELAHLRRCGAI